MNKRITDRSGECRNKHLGTGLAKVLAAWSTIEKGFAYTLPQVLSDAAKAYCSICPNPRLFVISGTGKELQKFAIHDPIVKFVDDREDSLDCLLSDNRCNIGETRSLRHIRLIRIVSIREIYHLREDFVIDNLLGKVVDHRRKVIQEANTQCTIRITK